MSKRIDPSKGKAVIWKGEIRHTERQCRLCGLVKVIAEFGITNYTTSAGNRSFRVNSKCRACNRLSCVTRYIGKEHERCAYQKKYRAENLEYVKSRDQRSRRQWKKGLRALGLTVEDYDLMYEQQEGKCLICDLRFDRLAVDHCHATGKVRGLLCKSCNLALGYIYENANTAERMALYVIAACEPLKEEVV